MLTFYDDVANALTSEQQEDGLAVADAVVRSVLETQSRNGSDLLAGDLADASSHRAEVHQASGMVAVQLGVPVADAEVRLRAHAYAANRSVVDIARDVVNRHLRLIDDGPTSADGVLV